LTYQTWKKDDFSPVVHSRNTVYIRILFIIFLKRKEIIMPVSEIFSIILMGAASLLCIALVIYLYKITQSVTTIQENISGLLTEFYPVINNITELTNKINVVTEELKQPVHEAVDVIDELKERVDVVFGIEEKIRNAIGANLLGIYDGIRTFYATYKSRGTDRRKRREKVPEDDSAQRIYSRQF
jgi:uncharacterized protein YoxC